MRPPTAHTAQQHTTPCTYQTRHKHTVIRGPTNVSSVPVARARIPVGNRAVVVPVVVVLEVLVLQVPGCRPWRVPRLRVSLIGPSVGACGSPEPAAGRILLSWPRRRSGRSGPGVPVLPSFRPRCIARPAPRATLRNREREGSIPGHARPRQSAWAAYLPRDRRVTSRSRSARSDLVSSSSSSSSRTRRRGAHGGPRCDTVATSASAPGGTPVVCVQQGLIYIRPRKKDTSTALKDREYGLSCAG